MLEYRKQTRRRATRQASAKLNFTLRYLVLVLLHFFFHNYFFPESKHKWVKKVRNEKKKKQILYPVRSMIKVQPHCCLRSLHTCNSQPEEGANVVGTWVSEFAVVNAVRVSYLEFVAMQRVHSTKSKKIAKNKSTNWRQYIGPRSIRRSGTKEKMFIWNVRPCSIAGTKLTNTRAAEESRRCFFPK